jgi:hypothetical protein
MRVNYLKAYRFFKDEEGKKDTKIHLNKRITGAVNYGALNVQYVQCETTSKPLIKERIKERKKERKKGERERGGGETMKRIVVLEIVKKEMGNEANR